MRLSGLLATKAGAYTAVALTAVMVAGVLGVYVKYRQVWDSIGRVHVTGLGKRPPRYNNALNVLLFGSDDRSRLTRRQQLWLHVGRDTENNTDTIMVVHISPGRRGATVMNIPRDTMVPVYSCAAGPGYAGQAANPGAVVQVNSLFAVGGVSCLWKTVEHLTGIRIDHFIELKFSGVVGVIDDIGGLRVCVPVNVHDSRSGLNLTAGPHHIGGLQFLQFWRARYSLGDGSDLQRIQRDDLLLAELLRKVLHSGLLSSPSKLVTVVSDAAKSITIDSGMSITDLLRIAESFRGLASKNVLFVRAPTVPYAPDPAHVQLAQPQADALFGAIAHDNKLPTIKKAARAGRHPTGKSGPGKGFRGTQAVPPSSVKVTVLNGSGVSQIAGSTAAALRGRGFQVTGTGNGPNYQYTTSVIRYGSSGGRAAAETLRRQLSSPVTIRLDPSVPAGTVQLILGSSYTALAAKSPKQSTRTQLKHLTKSNGGITGTATCKNNRAIF